MITGGQDGKLNVYHFNDSFFSIATLDTTLIINQEAIRDNIEFMGDINNGNNNHQHF